MLAMAPSNSDLGSLARACGSPMVPSAAHTENTASAAVKRRSAFAGTATIAFRRRSPRSNDIRKRHSVNFRNSEVAVGQRHGRCSGIGDTCLRGSGPAG